ncbi:MAG: ribonuclease HII [Flavobacteriales bacterium]
MLKNYLHKTELEVGCDEAGRGCLAGPVVAAAVILSKSFKNELLNDSKKLTERQRMLLKPIIEKGSLAFGVGIVSPREIDEINILNASFLAMHRALDKLTLNFSHILVDGNRFNVYKEIPHTCVIKGDGKYMSIAAASVLAKTNRDIIMESLHDEYSVYNWKKNKGYPTRDHRSAIKQAGSCIHHRKSFRLLPEQLKLDF